MLTGKELAGRTHDHVFVLEMPPCAPLYPSQTALGYVMRICQQHFHSAGEDIGKEGEGGGAFGEYFCFSLKAFNGTVKASAFYL